jgi:photosystem II stability/assembly factor-like uncharacterized protein
MTGGDVGTAHDTDGPSPNLVARRASLRNVSHLSDRVIIVIGAGGCHLLVS